MIAQAWSSTASWSGRAGRRPDRARRAGPRASRRRAGTSSMTTSDRACASSGRSRTSMRLPSPQTSSRRAARSRSRLATLTKTDRVTADGAVRTASATIAWFLRSRPTGRTVIGAPDRARSATASRARHRWRRGSGRRRSGPRACRRAPARRRGRRARLVDRDAVERLPDAPEVGRLVDDDPGAPVGGDDADLAAGRQVAERRRCAAALAAVSRFGSDVRGGHARRRVDDEDDVPRQPGRPLEERPRGEQREDRDEQQLEEQQQAAPELLPRRVGLDVGDQPRPQQRRRARSSRRAAA